jgi:predicted  nucleic acid-binding Zn-ribbon protein
LLPSTVALRRRREARDRISQIQCVFCSTSKQADSKRRPIEDLQREVDQGMALLGKIDKLEERLRRKTREAEEMESKRAESEGSCRKLVEQVESLSSELQAEKLKRNPW